MKTQDTNITVRKANERGRSQLNWLDSYHTFSFAEYMDPAHMGFSSLRVINDDVIQPGGGFGMHPHHSMEIFTYVISGELKHKDSMGNGSVIKAGEFQYMSAGEGVMHSEFNASEENPVHLLQIWIRPKHGGGEPLYHELDTNALEPNGGLTLFASGDGRDGSIQMRQNAEIYFGKLASDQTAKVEPSGTLDHTWLHLISGELSVDGNRLAPGDGAAISTSQFELEAGEDSEFLLFRLS